MEQCGRGGRCSSGGVGWPLRFESRLCLTLAASLPHSFKRKAVRLATHLLLTYQPHCIGAVSAASSHRVTAAILSPSTLDRPRADQHQPAVMSSKRSKGKAATAAPSSGSGGKKKSSKAAAPARRTSPRKAAELQSDDDMDEGVYELERVTGKFEEDDGEVFYQVKWKGFTQETTEPAENLASAPAAIEEFERRLAEEEREAKAKGRGKAIPSFMQRPSRVSRQPQRKSAPGPFASPEIVSGKRKRKQVETFTPLRQSTAQRLSVELRVVM